MQCIECNTDTLLRPFVQAQRAVQEERFTVHQVHAAFLEPHDPNLRTLQITQQADVATAVIGSLAQLAGALTMLVRAAVRKIEARDVKPGFDHLAQYLGSL